MAYILLFNPRIFECAVLRTALVYFFCNFSEIVLGGNEDAEEFDGAEIADVDR